MESDDDLLFSDQQEPPSPIHDTKLRRLKKASKVSNSPPAKTREDHAPLMPIADFLEGSGSVESEKSPNLLSVSGFDEGLEMNDGSQGRKASDLEEEEEEEELNGLEAACDGNRDVGSFELDGATDGPKLEKSTKKRRSSRGEKGKEKNKKKKFESFGEDWKPPEEESGRNKRKLEKEREAYLDLIHAESQRLLRETRDASFKPVPFVQKPISSVLEKIRLRKLEVSKKSGISISSNGLLDTANSLRDISENLEPQHAESAGSGDREYTEKGEGMCDVQPESSNPKAVEGSGVPDSLLSRSESTLSNTASSRESHHAAENPSNDTEELLRKYQLNNSEEKQTQDLTESSQEEDAFTPSVLVTNLRLGSAAPDDESSDEEYDDKENIDPHSRKVFDVDTYPKGDPVKAFVDDEAEEEDDSDNDLMRFQENEEDEDREDIEGLDDLIVTGYKEMPIDSARRDELHQKWLEQQDAAATENVLQRLKCGWKEKDPTLACEEDEEQLGEDSVDESMDDELQENVAQKSSKKAKQMIAQMYNDADDIFVSSDDEETEQRIVRQRLLEQNEEQASFLSPVEDENSREVFGLIKKLNIVPDTKKRAKTTSFFETLVTGGNSNSSSKSSFLGRSQGNSVPSSHKQGSSVVRSFIFGRDDSNSRSSFSASERSSDKGQKENQLTGEVLVKLSSQSKSVGRNKKIDTNASSGSSLFEILRQSSMHSDLGVKSKRQSSNLEIRQSQAVYQFSAFRSSKKAIKIESKNVMRES